MEHRNDLQAFGAASRAHRLIRFNLHRVALRTASAASVSIKPKHPEQHAGDVGGKCGVVHPNVDRCVQRRRRRVRIEADAASARKGVVTLEAEVAESTVQLKSLDEFIQQLRGRLGEVESHFGKGRVLAPVAGIVSTAIADVGQSLTAGTPIAEILDPTDIFVAWYIPNERLIDPTVGHEVFVLFGNRRIPGTIAQILPVSGVYAGTQQQLLVRGRPGTQIARIRFDPDASPPPLNTTVDVRMHYTAFSARVANVLVHLFGLYGN